jgi:diacylglycerol kinase family enzyme
MASLILVNPSAGNNQGKRWLTDLRAWVVKAGLEQQVYVRATGPYKTGPELNSSASEIERVIVVGGDGTVSEVIDRLIGRSPDVPLGIVPLGTGNDLARSVGLYRGRGWNQQEALAYLQAEQTKRLDIWSLNDSLTFNNYLSIGLDAQVVSGFDPIRRALQAHQLLCRKSAYFAVYFFVWLRHLGGRVPPNSRLQWVGADGSEQQLRLRSARVVALSNTPYYAAGALMDPKAAVNDGQVEVTVFPHMRNYVELMAMRLPLLAQAGVQERWWRTRACRLTIHMPETTPVQADGEDVTSALGEVKTLFIRPRGQVSLLMPGFGVGVPATGRTPSTWG